MGLINYLSFDLRQQLRECSSVESAELSFVCYLSSRVDRLVEMKEVTSGLNEVA